MDSWSAANACTHRDGDNGGSDDLAGVALLVDLAETSPLAQLDLVVDLEQVDAVLGAQGLNQLDVVVLIAVRGQHNEMRLAPVEREPHVEMHVAAHTCQWP